MLWGRRAAWTGVRRAPPYGCGAGGPRETGERPSPGPHRMKRAPRHRASESSRAPVAAAPVPSRRSAEPPNPPGRATGTAAERAPCQTDDVLDRRSPVSDVARESRDGIRTSGGNRPGARRAATPTGQGEGWPTAPRVGVRRRPGTRISPLTRQIDWIRATPNSGKRDEHPDIAQIRRAAGWFSGVWPGIAMGPVGAVRSVRGPGTDRRRVSPWRSPTAPPPRKWRCGRRRSRAGSCGSGRLRAAGWRARSRMPGRFPPRARVPWSSSRAVR